MLQTASTAAITLTLCYWTSDYEPGSPVVVTNPFKHGVSAVLLLLDVFLSRAPIVSYHVAVRECGRGWVGASSGVYLWCAGHG